MERDLTAEQMDELGVGRWAIISWPPSERLWICDEPETSYVLAGQAKILTESGQTIAVGPSDLIHCPAGSICTWVIRDELKRRFIMG